MTNGAQALITTLVDSGVQVCFANPGTSEMHFVAALDSVPQMRGVLCLFEGVVTGAADGYARIAGKPAATLLHLGPGLSNGLANLILPADISWDDGAQPAGPVDPVPAAAPDEHAVAEIAEVLRSGEPVALLIGGPAVADVGALQATDRIAAATGARALVETFPARLARGAGVPAIDRLGYLAEQAAFQLDGIKHLVVAGTRAPVSFFAYPGKPSDLVPEGCAVHNLAGLETDVAAALTQLADAVAPGVPPRPAPAAAPELPAGPLTPQNWVQVIGALLPEGAIISDESNTSGLMLPAATTGAPRHDVLALTGGAIGQGLPVALGAAVAAPDRPVIALQADGSAAYTISALWSMAREHADVTTVLINNSSYAILRMELARVGAAGEGGRYGAKAEALLDLSRPNMDFAKIAEGFGVPASVATTCEELAEQFQRALAEPGPHLIDARIPSVF
jgi:acetolactate synthase-1/2/3 large subunit